MNDALEYRAQRTLSNAISVVVKTKSAAVVDDGISRVKEELIIFLLEELQKQLTSEIVEELTKVLGKELKDA